MKATPAVPKIVKLYDVLLNEQKLDEVNWDDFFLLRPHIPELTAILESWDGEAFRTHSKVIQATVAAVMRIIDGEQGLKLYNACQTLSLFVYYIGRKITNSYQAQCIFLPGTPELFARKFSQRFRDIVVGDGPLILKRCFLNTMICLWNAFPRCKNNILLSTLANDDSFQALLHIFSNSELKDLQSDALYVFVVMLRCSLANANLSFLHSFSSLEDSIAIMGILNYIQTEIRAGVDNFSSQFTNERNFFSVLSSKMVGLFFAADEASTPAPEPSYNIVALLFLYSAVKLNRNFTVMLASPPNAAHLPVLGAGDVLNNGHASAISLLLTLASFVFSGFKSDNRQQESTLCMMILWFVVCEPYLQSTMHDIHLSGNVALFKAPMLHRAATFEPIASDSKILSAGLLELMTDFNATHLMQNYPFFHYHLSIDIIHRILIYQKKCRIRLSSWKPLFNSLVLVINFLSHNEHRLLTDDVFKLLHRILLVVNFFITYGDSFLPDATAYDFLYYEISRQCSVFLKLESVVKESTSKSDYVSKVSDQLTNILSIIEHIRPKLEVLAQSYPTEDQVINVVQDAFQDLTLRFYDGLENVDHHEFVRMDAQIDQMVEKIAPPVPMAWSEATDYNLITEYLDNTNLA